jgi:threonine dehydrogenase-like Zn-dependent dehydrogenase
LEQVIRLAASKGKIVILSLAGKEHTVPTDMVVRKELQIMGSLIHTGAFPESMALLKSAGTQTTPLYTDKLSLDELDEALREYTSRDRMKMLIRI